MPGCENGTWTEKSSCRTGWFYAVVCCRRDLWGPSLFFGELE